jgi:hypothetical protein
MVTRLQALRPALIAASVEMGAISYIPPEGRASEGYARDIGPLSRCR